ARVHMWLVQSRPPGPEACYTYYTSSDVIRRHQTSSDVIRRHQTSSDVIRRGIQNNLQMWK
ncbi:hypothetical protein Tco_0263568, partial [Tanacetum coccineum]